MGERGTDSKMFIGCIVFLAVAGALWQWLRYRVHLESVANGTYGQPSLLYRLFSGPAVFTGEKGGRYIVGNKEQKLYIKNGSAALTPTYSNYAGSLSGPTRR